MCDGRREVSSWFVGFGGLSYHSKCIDYLKNETKTFICIQTDTVIHPQVTCIGYTTFYLRPQGLKLQGLKAQARNDSNEIANFEALEALMNFFN